VNEREKEWSSLMRAAIEGDEAAYSQLLRSLAPALRAGVRRGLARTGLSGVDAEDILQETLIAIHLKRHTWDRDAPVTPWVFAIAHHKLIDALRRHGRRVFVPIDDIADALEDQSEPPASSHEVERHVRQLSPRQQDVVRAIAMDGRSISETATRLGMSEGAVRVSFHRGLAALAAKMRS
jgi:RNA polymerase sigma-70 factor (ECF subfamily)